MPTEPMTAARLAAIRGSLARTGSTPQARAIQELLQEVGRLRAAKPAACPLSQAELPILLDIANGHTVQKSARRQGRTLHTVKSHRHNILRRLGVDSSAQAAAIAVKHGWITPDDIPLPGREQR